jgi:hypothetical protein
MTEAIAMIETRAALDALDGILSVEAWMAFMSDHRIFQSPSLTGPTSSRVAPRS